MTVVVGDQDAWLVARAFLLIEKRANLPKVPACVACNEAKAGLEHYLTALMPFGGTHRDAGATLGTLVPSRLAENARLHRELAKAWEQRADSSLPIDAQKLVQLCELIARGLAFHHWRLLLPPDECVVHGGFPTPEARATFEPLLAANGTRVKGDFGEGAFVYEGVQDLWLQRAAGASVSGTAFCGPQVLMELNQDYTTR